MNVTIKDIARETGLSTATISKYLNHKKILEENRILIEETIKRLDYKPNRTAQLLRSKKTKTIGILLSDLGNYFWSPIIYSVTHFFTKYHYTVITCSYYFEHQKESDTIQNLISQNVDGVIMLPNNQQDQLYKIFQEAGIPVVILDQLPESLMELPVDCVISDNYGGGAMLAGHLLEKGHRNVYILEHSIYSYTLKQRIQGFIDTFSKEGYDISALRTDLPPIPFGQTHHVISQGKQRFRQIMCSSTPPTAIFFTNFLFASGGLSAANSARYSIPEDISLVCFDDDPLFKVMHSPLTCVAQNLNDIGAKASEILMQRMEGDFSDFPQKVVVDVTFYPRQSVKDLKPKS